MSATCLPAAMGPIGNSIGDFKRFCGMPNMLPAPFQNSSKNQHGHFAAEANGVAESPRSMLDEGHNPSGLGSRGPSLNTTGVPSFYIWLHLHLDSVMG